MRIFYEFFSGISSFYDAILPFFMPIGAVVFFVSAFNLILVFPLYFCLKIIPEIEKKIGKKLEFSMLYYGWNCLGRYFGGVVEIPFYILLKYFNIKGVDPLNVLEKAKYQKNKISKKEIAWSFIVTINFFY